MSEPLSSGDVERVLDNIRKLVSTQPAERQATRERLMLTSDLRVPQQEAAVAPDAAAANPDEQPAAPQAAARPAPIVEGPAEDLSLEARIAQLESAVAAEQGFEPDGSEAQDPPLPGAMPDLAARFAEDAGAPDIASKGHANGADALDGDAPGLGVPDETGTELPVAATSALPATADDNVSVSDSWAFDILPSDTPPYEEPREQSHDSSDTANPAATSEPTSDAPAPETTTATEAPSVDTEDGDTTAGLHFVHSEQPRSTASLADEDDGVIDEELLREMISEIVREELAGALGERITRNVKKLVRREIMRALSAREFD